jgi:hypothetical protein
MPEDTLEPALAAILGDIANTLELLADLEARKARLLTQLDAFRETGQLPDKLKAHGLAFTWSPGRKSYDYPDAVLALKAQLKEAQEVAEATGTATAKPMKPFWTVRPSK